MKAKHSADYARSVGKYYCCLQFVNMCGLNTTAGVILQIILEVYVFTGPAQSGILSDREVVNLFLHFTVNPKPKVDYIDRPRCCLRGKECSINRFQQVESRWGYSGTSDRIR